MDAVTLTVSLRYFLRHFEDSIVLNFWPWTLGLVAGLFFGGVSYFLLVLILDIQDQVTSLRRQVDGMSRSPVCKKEKAIQHEKEL